MKNNFNYKNVIRARNFSEVFIWIDTAYYVHGNMRIHTGGAISMGYMIIHEEVLKQKTNVNSLTEAEIVVVSE